MHMKAFLLIVIYITILFAGKSASAKIFDYSSTNLQLLHGNTYEFGDKERNIVTLEHNDGWKYGDNFAFVDMTVSNHAFARFSPRLSLSKISNKNLSYGIIKDVLVAGMVNYYGYHSKPHKNLLYGIGLNWDLPYFKFFQTNFYVRDNPDLSGKSHQVTFIWNLPIKISKHKLLIEGFAEIVSNEGKKYKSNNWLFQDYYLMLVII